MLMKMIFKSKKNPQYLEYFPLKAKNYKFESKEYQSKKFSVGNWLNIIFMGSRRFSFSLTFFFVTDF